MRAVHALLAFVVELGMLVAFGLFGVWISDGVLGVVLGVAGVLLAVAIWSVWLAPKAMRPTERRVALRLKGGLFAVATALLVISGHVPVAIVFGVAAAVSVGLEIRLGPAAEGFEGLTP